MGEVATALGEHGRTPRRGLGTLRILDYTWDNLAGKRVYLDSCRFLRDEARDRGYAAG